MRALTTFLAISFVLLLTSCGGSATTEKASAEKRYELRGEVVKIDPANQVATIKHEKIGDWMDAMTMEFPIKPKTELDKLSPGDQITGTVIVNGMDYHVSDIKIVAKKAESSK